MRILIVVLLGLLATACGEKRSATEKAAPITPVRTAKVESHPGLVEIAGTVRAGDVADLASRFGGYVRSVSVRAGDRVKKGDLLVLVDEGGLQAQGSKIQAAEREVQEAIEEARNHVKAAEAQRELATNTFERYRKLHERNAASKQEYEEALSRKEAAEAGWQAAQRRLAQASSKLDQVRADQRELATNVTYQRITAPFDGVISSVPANTGTFVQPGQTVVSIENPQTFHFLFAVEQDLLQAISRTVRVKMIAISDEPVEASVLEVSPAAERDTRTYRVKALLPSNQSLRSGLSGVVQIKSTSESLWIPAEFLKTTKDLETVVVQEESQWRRVLVKSGIRRGDQVEILSGLAAGDQIALLEEPR